MYQTSHDEGRIANGVFEYNITDHNNDLRVAFRDSLGVAVPVQSIFYDPWGLSMKGMSITRNPLNFNRYQFLSRELQIETGLVDLMKRQYDPPTGRFLSQDPIIEGQEHLSLYQYGWNNPVLKPDPNGDCPFCPALPFIPQIGAGLVAAGELITAAFISGTTGTAIATAVAPYSDSKAFIPYGVQMVAHKVEGEMSQRNTKSQSNNEKTANSNSEIKKGDYGHLKEPRKVGEGKETTASQRKRILEENKKQNEGELTSDGDGRKLNPPSNVKKGEKADMNQAEVDHKLPRSKGGSNSNSNQRVISKEENLQKGNRQQ